MSCSLLKQYQYKRISDTQKLEHQLHQLKKGISSWKGIRAQIQMFLSTWYFHMYQIKQVQINPIFLNPSWCTLCSHAKMRLFFCPGYTPMHFCMCGNHKQASPELPIEAAPRQRQHCWSQTTKLSPAPLVSHKVALKHAAFIPPSCKVKSKEGFMHSLLRWSQNDTSRTVHPESKSQLPLTRDAKQS